MTSLRTRRRLINRLKEEGIKDPKVLEAILNTPRHLFVEEALAHRAYEDVSLPIGYGQTISQPYIVARMSELLIEGGNVGKVLEVGTGSGYQTAILSQLVSEVVSLERIKALHDIAGERLHTLGYDNVALYFSDGFKAGVWGWVLASLLPFLTCDFLTEFLVVFLACNTTCPWLLFFEVFLG